VFYDISVVYVGIVAVTTRSCSVAATPNETPRTTPLTAIQPSMLPPGRSAPSNEESSERAGDGGSGATAGHGSTDDQTASNQKQTPCLLPADNFGVIFRVFSLHNGVYVGVPYICACVCVELCSS